MNITSVSKKLATTLAAVVAITLASAPSHAFSSVNKSTYTASVTLTGPGSASMNATLYYTETNLPTGSNALGFGAVSLPAGFVKSDSYILVTGTVTAGNGRGIQIYTDNTNAAFAGTKSTTTINPAGLVRQSDGLQTLPLAWSVSLSTSTPPVFGVTPNQTNQPVTDHLYQWEYFMDAGQTVDNSGKLFANAAPYIMLKTAAGYQTNTNSWFGGGRATGYVYTQADFSGAATSSTGVTYATNAIILEAFTQ